MQKRNLLILKLLPLLGLVAAFTVYFVWPDRNLEVQERKTKESSDGRWRAVVQMEVYSAGFVSDAVYAIRLKGPKQKDRHGDLVMNVPVNYPDPEPSIEWSNGMLVVTLADHQKYQYFVTPVDGVPVTLQQ
jgi:hypothetical protein